MDDSAIDRPQAKNEHEPLVPPPDDAPPRPAAPQRGTRRVLLAMCLGLMLSMLNTSMIHIITPQISSALGATSLSGVQWVGDIFTLGCSALLLPGGALGNRIGRRSAFLWGTTLCAVGSLLCALSPDLAILLAARTVQAIGVAVMLPQTLSILVYEYPDRAGRASAVGIWAGVASLGVAGGPVVGGVLVTIANWRAAFLFSMVIALIALVLAYPTLSASRHGRPAEAPRIDIAGSVLSVVWLTALVYGLIEVSNYGWGSPLVIASLVAAAAGAVLFCVLQARIASRGDVPLMPLHLWRVRGFVAANVAGWVYFLALTGIIFYYNLYFQDYLHRSALDSGLLFLPMTGLMAVLGPCAGRLAARYSTSAVLVSGLLVSGAGCLALFLLRGGATLMQVEWRLALFGAGVGLMSSAMSNAAVSSVPAGSSGTASAVHNTCRKIGSALGVALLGVFVTSTGSTTASAAVTFMDGVSNAMLLCAVLLLGCAAGAFVLMRRQYLGADSDVPGSRRSLEEIG